MRPKLKEIFEKLNLDLNFLIYLFIFLCVFFFFTNISDWSRLQIVPVNNEGSKTQRELENTEESIDLCSISVIEYLSMTFIRVVI